MKNLGALNQTIPTWNIEFLRKGNMDDNSSNYQQNIKRYGTPPKSSFPLSFLEIFKRSNSNQKPSKSTKYMSSISENMEAVVT